MEEIDYTTIQAKVAYLDPKEGRCRLNHLLCEDGDCRRCNFVVDSSLMLVADSVCRDLAHIKQLMGAEEDCGCGCDCGCGH
ncbi:MAG: hypothetical protein IJF47_00130 [Candidatus Methanomethylophilaceae archaeon]|nr:hypothetical protein [Thermoplasmata archaeon]MBQ2762109.1 hypothetical protein [Candidatus Methanomethylophilaceae archaeon]